jgi:hypothetical protein
MLTIKPSRDGWALFLLCNASTILCNRVNLPGILLFASRNKFCQKQTANTG